MQNIDHAPWSSSESDSFAIQDATGAFKVALKEVQAIQKALDDTPTNKWSFDPTGLPVVVTQNNSDSFNEIERSDVIFSWAHHSIVDRLGDIYRFNRKHEKLSRSYLKNHRPLPVFVENSYKYISKYFPGSFPYIDMLIDPEADNDTRLIVYISTMAKPKEAITQLHNLEDELDLIGFEQLDKYISFNLEFE